jgi:hypothetical protein
MFEAFQNRMLRQVNGAFADKLQRRTLRRVLVVATIASALLLGIAIDSGSDRVGFLALAAIPFWISMVLLNFSLRGIFELDDERLDEHQVAVRNAAYKTAYGFTLIFLVLVTTVVAALDLDRVEMFAVAAVAFLICAVAPRLITAWSTEDGYDGE